MIILEGSRLRTDSFLFSPVPSFTVPFIELIITVSVSVFFIFLLKAKEVSFPVCIRSPLSFPSSLSLAILETSLISFCARSIF